MHYISWAQTLVKWKLMLDDDRRLFGVEEIKVSLVCFQVEDCEWWRQLGRFGDVTCIILKMPLVGSNMTLYGFGVSKAAITL